MQSTVNYNIIFGDIKAALNKWTQCTSRLIYREDEIPRRIKGRGVKWNPKKVILNLGKWVFKKLKN